MQTQATLDFIARATATHGDKFDYSQSVYTNADSKVSINCSTHGAFFQRAIDHTRGSGCSKCGRVEMRKGFKTKEALLEEFISKAKGVHGDRYDYSGVDYVNSYTKVAIRCPKHGDFMQLPGSHLQGTRCAKCVVEEKVIWFKNSGVLNGPRSPVLTTEEYIAKASERHNGFYSYDRAVYTYGNKPIIITCPVHGDFKIMAFSHLKKSGCYECGRAKIYLAKTKTKEHFVNKAKGVHGDRYDYSAVDYKGVYIGVDIICAIHGTFQQKPIDHYGGNNCPGCSKDALRELLMPSREEVIDKFIAIHRHLYTYDNFEYNAYDVKSNITCPKHGDFLMSADTHTNGTGCPKCTGSSGELLIGAYLEELGIRYTREFRLPLESYEYDFKLDDYDVLIEFHGVQHFRPVDYFGGESKFRQQVYNDEVKVMLAKLYKLTLITLTHEHMDKGVLQRLLTHKLKIAGVIPIPIP